MARNPHGALVLVVGPSGAGKDSLIAGAKQALASDPRFVFPRRLVTRMALIDIEDHESVDADTFARQRDQGEFALSWEAHGLHYALPKAVAAEFASGRVVVCNISRRVVAEARRLYPRSSIVLITADPEIRERRLASRGRETRADIAGRLGREAALPNDVAPITVDNSGTLAAGIAAFVAVLKSIAGR
jgi:ribose 1,5-bisphosphokinase